MKKMSHHEASEDGIAQNTTSKLKMKRKTPQKPKQIQTSLRHVAKNSKKNISRSIVLRNWENFTKVNENHLITRGTKPCYVYKKSK